MITAPDPYDTRLRSAYDHRAWYDHGEPYQGEVEDTGLRCYCGREVVADMSIGIPGSTGWAHVGIGDRSDPTGEPVR